MNFITSSLSAPLASATSLSFTVTMVLSVSTYLLTLATGYWSYVDRLWSLLPGVHVLLYALWPGAGDRERLMAVLVCMWCGRLTYNFARKGGYGDEEDYRWAVIRSWFKEYRVPVVAQQLFLVGFVSFYQLLLIWGFSAGPAHHVRLAGPTELNAYDALLALAFLAFLAMETYTDDHQFDFQTKKHKMTAAQRARAGGTLFTDFHSFFFSHFFFY
jgi:steroid 5-alpha reductase family enzyme